MNSEKKKRLSGLHQEKHRRPFAPYGALPSQAREPCLHLWPSRRSRRQPRLSTHSDPLQPLRRQRQFAEVRS